MSKENEHTIETHDKYTDIYVEILQQYKSQISTSVEKKNYLKENFFNLMEYIILILLFLFIACLCASYVLFEKMIIFNSNSVATIAGAITAMISSFITMLLAIMKLPKIIARYLFNKKEDKLMAEIIKNIQKYEIKAVNIDKMSMLQTLSDNDNDIKLPNTYRDIKTPIDKIKDTSKHKS